MRILLVLILVKILELSRNNLTNFNITRSFYDRLSLLLILTFFLYVLLSKYTLPFEKKIESYIQRVASKRIVLLDVVLLVLVSIAAYKAVGMLYTHPIRCMTADMLPMIRGAGEYFLSGENPFNKTFCPWNISFYYLPMMMVYYLPSLLAKIDIRFISVLCFALLILLLYYYSHKKGSPLMGFLISIILISSGLFPFLMLSIHTLPYLLVFSCFFIALSEENNKALFFTFAILLMSQKFFWLYVPFILIFLIKKQKINLSNIKAFAGGILLGIFPLLLFPNAVFVTYIDHLKRQSQHISSLKGTYQLVHSLGFAHYLSDHRLLSAVISLSFFSLLFILALKFIKKSNLWFFLSIVTLIMTYIQSQTRAQEYYFIPLLVMILFSPINFGNAHIPKCNLALSALLLAVFVICISLYYPFVSGHELVVNPLRGHKIEASSGYNIYKGYAELSLGGNFWLQKDRSLELVIRNHDYRENEPAQAKITINGKQYFYGNFDSRKIQLSMDRTSMREYFYIGANDVEIDLLKQTNFSIRINFADNSSDTNRSLR